MANHLLPMLRPPYDQDLLAHEDTQHRPIPRSAQDLEQMRREEPSSDPLITEDPAICIEDRVLLGPQSDIKIKIFQSAAVKTDPQIPRPGILFLHAGGRIQGNPFVGLASVIDTVKQLNAVIISPSYRLAPEFQGNSAAEDCYATLLWIEKNYKELNIDLERLMIAGVSAGGGLAASTALVARDRGGPRLRAQLLVCPMLDDRCDSLSSKQFDLDTRGYYTQFGHYAWRCVLGDLAGREEGVSYYAAAGRATDLSHLPQAYIDVGSSEPFRDEDIAYATKLWQSGVQADLHVWSGGSHGFDLFERPTWIGDQAKRARFSWLCRVLS